MHLRVFKSSQMHGASPVARKPRCPFAQYCSTSFRRLSGKLRRTLFHSSERNGGDPTNMQHAPHASQVAMIGSRSWLPPKESARHVGVVAAYSKYASLVTDKRGLCCDLTSKSYGTWPNYAVCTATRTDSAHGPFGPLPTSNSTS